MAALALLVVLITPTSARGQTGGDEADVSRAELEALVERARTEPNAVDDLRGVARVDGRPVDLDTALGDATGADLAARLGQLGVGGEGQSADPTADPRDDARRILDGDRYRPSRAPQPFRGALQWLADRLEPVGAAVIWVFANRARAVIALALVATLSLVVAARLVRRRNRSAVERLDRARRRGGGVDADALERAAEQAERAGDLDAAVRFRFVAGLARLEESRAPVRVGGPSGDLSRRLRSPSFDDLAGDFDEVVYGGRPASVDDVERARRNWPAVVQEARR